MRNVVLALKGIGYRLLLSRISEEEKAIWSSLVASATSEQQSINLTPAEKQEWEGLVMEVQKDNCIQCYFYGSCLKHD
jgi:hypothetical protein